MYLADYHTHTQLSPDARHSMTEMAAGSHPGGHGRDLLYRPCGAAGMGRTGDLRAAL